MKIGIFVLAAICAALPCAAQSGNLSDWGTLIDKKQCEAAKNLCMKFVNSSNIAEQAEAQKCLANAALCGHDTVQLEGDDAGGGNMHGSYTPEAIDEALIHLNLGIKIAPQDLSIHKGRLYLLEVSGRYYEMIKALDESCTLYKGTDAPDTWLGYAPEIADLGHFEVGLELMKVLDRHYPNTPDIVANIGGFLLMMKKPAEAIPYLQQSVQLSPQDSLNAWDLGRAYDYTDQIQLAEKWYKKALSLPQDRDMESDVPCLYAEFVETKLNDRTRACKLEKQNCPAEKQTACAALTPTPPKAP
jgi:tetratricopeptide (TPR) repeat protein